MHKKLQVFVSSTYTDLIEERQAAVEAILDAGHIPAGMELFKAGNESQLKTIYKWIDESDVYMLILGGRYGSIEHETGKSYTQLEYEYAFSKSVPIFTVVLSQSFLTKKINTLGLSNVTEQDSPNKYQLFKSLVMSKIIREVDDCKDIKIAIYSTLNEFLENYDLIGWIKGNSLVTQTINIKDLFKVFQRTIIYIENEKRLNANEYLLQNITYFFIGVSKSYCYEIYCYYSNIYFQNGILEKVINNHNGEETLKLSRFGADYYNYLVLNS